MRGKILAIIVIYVIAIGTFGAIPTAPVGVMTDTPLGLETQETSPEIVQDALNKLLAEENPYPADLDLNEILGDRNNEYQMVYEPWKSKAAIHAIAYHEETGFLALGGGYLYDNEVHMFRLNIETGEFDKVWELGDGIIQSDVLSVDFGDTDLNEFLEVVVGSSDGHVYVFEQLHIFDPNTNTENMFELVWTSPGLFKVFAVKVDDIDRDYRPDIIAASWDGKVHLWEYTNHSGYPFVEEHWIDYTEVATLEVGEKIYSLETGDTNENGLPEIIVGTREGTVFVFENAGTTLMINGQPFPLIRDNTYYLNWTSGNYTWQPIRSIDIGELDGTPGDEIALVSEGQGVYTLDWNRDTRSYDYKKVQNEFSSWETFGFHALDYWVDSIVWANNVTYIDAIDPTINVYEPIEYVWNDGLEIFEPDASVYPYNTGMAQITDGNYSIFDAALSTVDNATAVVDFGLDEEGTGGANAEADMIITFRDSLTPALFSEFNLSISQDGFDFMQIPSEYMEIMLGDNHKLLIDVDGILVENRLDWFRYAKVSVYNSGNYSINSIELLQVYNLITDALSLAIGPLRRDGDAYREGFDESNKIVVATTIGEFYCIGYESGKYDVLWESYEDERFSLGSYVWDIEYISSVAEVPIFDLLGTLNPIDPHIGNYNSWSYGIPSPIYMAGDNMPYYIVGTDTSIVTALDMSGETDFSMTGRLSATLSPHDYTSAEIVKLWPATPEGLMPMVVVGGYSPDGRYADPTSWSSRSNIMFYYRNTPNEDFMEFGSIKTFDFSGEITQMLSMSQATPRMSFADYDNDNDLDMVISNGFVYLAKNLFTETGFQYFQLQPGYFDEINLDSGSILWGQPQWVDINGDDVLDLVLNYETKYGATCFLNKGTHSNPVWHEDRRIFNNPDTDTAMTLLKLKDIRLVPNTGGYSLQRITESSGFELNGDFSLAAYHEDTGSLKWALTHYDAIDTYLTASYPRVSRIDFCLMKGEIFKNLGYHMHESWNTDFDLEDWSLTISSGDLDGDGRGEIVVGDYDNNVYAFEHLSNATYKRMFRSLDLNHTEISDSSPYAYQELEGISGEFNRRIWDHAKHLITGTDLDQDGLTELIITSDLQVYIYEATGIDDTIELAYSFDLRDLGYLNEESDAWEEVTEITAIEAGVDLDSDGRRDLVVAVGPFLFVFNIDVDSFNGLEFNDFFGRPGDDGGRYYLLGNPEGADMYQGSDIRSLAVGDIDNDSHPEIVLGGVYDTRVSQHSGFAYIYECWGGTFQKVWEAPPDIVTSNPVSVVLIDDQDYDSNLEVIIGHSNGFDIMEWDPSSEEYINAAKVTSSPNYPNVQLESILFSGLDTITFTNRCANDMAYGIGVVDDQAVMVLVNNEQLQIKGLNTTSLQVVSAPLVPFISQTTSGDYGDVTVASEAQPSITSNNNAMWLTWKVERDWGQSDFWVSRLGIGDMWWSDPVPVLNDTESLGSRNHPEVFVYNSTHIGIIYVKNNLGTSEAYYFLMKEDLTEISGPYLLTFPGWATFDIQKISAIRMPTGDFEIAMSAINTLTSKTDYDIWSLHCNASFNFTNSIPHRATDSHYDEMYPDVDYLRNAGNPIVIAYEVGGAPFEKRSGMVASIDNGSTWSDQNSLNTYPDYLEKSEYPGFPGLLTYFIGITPYQGPMTYSPSVLGHLDTGFVYLQAFNIFDIGGGPNPDVLWGYNPSSDWVDNHLRDVSNMVVGDTDSDGRREVIVSYDATIAVYEMVHSTNGSGYMTYEEVYLSEPFIYDITGLTVYDSDNNGWEEIGVSCERGEVFIWEYRDPSHGPSDFKTSDVTSSLHLYGGAIGYVLDSGDVDGDSRDEVVFSTLTGSPQMSLYMLDDNGTIAWNVTHSTTLLSLELSDLDGDGTQEIICIQWGEEFLLAYSGLDGHLLWNCTVFSADIEDMDIGDIDGNGVKEVIVGSQDGVIWVVNSTGNLWHSEAVDSGAIWGLTVGDFTDDDILGVAYANDTYAVKVINPLDGTLLYESPNDMVSHNPDPQPMEAHDFNFDGYDDVLFGNDVMMRMVDVVSGTIFYNSSVHARLMDLIIDDFDGDNTAEVFVLTKDGGAYLVEVGTLRMQWHYDSELVTPDQYDYFHVSAASGRFGGTGGMDIAINVNSTELAVIDGRSGLPLWVNFIEEKLGLLSSADFDDDDVDSVVTLYWNYPAEPTSSYLVTFDGIDFTGPSIEPQYVPHIPYWDEDVGYTIQGTWAADLNHDEYDEVFIRYDDDRLAIWDAYTNTLITTISSGNQIDMVRFGDIDNSGNTDFAFRIDEDTIGLAEGETFAKLGYIYAPTGFEIVDYYIGDFNGIYTEDEVVVLFEKPLGSEAYLAWYNYDTLLYKSSVNSTDDHNQLAVGYFRGSIFMDAVFGGDENIARVYNGATGAYLWEYNMFTDIEEIDAGYFNDDAYEDFALSSGVQVRVIDSHPSIEDQMYSVAPGASIREVHAADLYLNDGVDELVLNVRYMGVQGYDNTSTIVWSYDALLSYPTMEPWSHYTTCVFGDMNSDGHTDMVFTNHEYINVIDGHTGDFLWHYVRNASISDPVVGHFDGPSSKDSMDIAAYSGSLLYIISDDQKPLLPPLPMGGFMDPNAVISQLVVTISLTGFFVAIPLGIIVVYVKRKEVE
ncbi:MAG: hypothetical protein RTV31_00935 [Candidatus Thorarchaeota archaeon]